jgi:hypothetical protein
MKGISGSSPVTVVREDGRREENEGTKDRAVAMLITLDIHLLTAPHQSCLLVQSDLGTKKGQEGMRELRTPQRPSWPYCILLGTYETCRRFCVASYYKFIRSNGSHAHGQIDRTQGRLKSILFCAPPAWITTFWSVPISRPARNDRLARGVVVGLF